jgi:hypothetical protein
MCLGRRKFDEFKLYQRPIDIPGDTSTEAPDTDSSDTDTVTTDYYSESTVSTSSNTLYRRTYGFARKRVRIAWFLPEDSLFVVEFVPKRYVIEDLVGLEVSTGTEDHTIVTEEDLQSQAPPAYNYARTSLFYESEEEEEENRSTHTTPSERADPSYMPPRTRRTNNTDTQSITDNSGIARRIVTRSYSKRYVFPTAYSTSYQNSIRLQPLNPCTVVVDKATKSYVGGKHKYNEGWNCWTVKPIYTGKLYVNHIRKRVCFTEETTYYSGYTDTVNRRDKPVRDQDKPVPLIVWVRTCEELLYRESYRLPEERRFPKIVKADTKGINVLDNYSSYLPGRIATHVLDIDNKSIDEVRTFHPRPKLVLTRNLPHRCETNEYLIVYAADLPPEITFPFDYPYYPGRDERIY